MVLANVTVLTAYQLNCENMFLRAMGFSFEEEPFYRASSLTADTGTEIAVRPAPHILLLYKVK